MMTTSPIPSKVITKNNLTITHSGTNRVWRSVTTLIEANALPLSQTANNVGNVGIKGLFPYKQTSGVTRILRQEGHGVHVHDITEIYT